MNVAFAREDAPRVGDVRVHEGRVATVVSARDVDDMIVAELSLGATAWDVVRELTGMVNPPTTRRGWVKLARALPDPVLASWAWSQHGTSAVVSTERVPRVRGIPPRRVPLGEKELVVQNDKWADDVREADGDVRVSRARDARLSVARSDVVMVRRTGAARYARRAYNRAERRVGRMLAREGGE